MRHREAAHMVNTAGGPYLNTMLTLRVAIITLLAGGSCKLQYHVWDRAPATGLINKLVAFEIRYLRA